MRLNKKDIVVSAILSIALVLTYDIIGLLQPSAFYFLLDNPSFALNLLYYPRLILLGLTYSMNSLLAVFIMPLSYLMWLPPFYLVALMIKSFSLKKIPSIVVHLPQLLFILIIIITISISLTNAKNSPEYKVFLQEYGDEF